jgi:hypothetical protein
MIEPIARIADDRTPGEKLAWRMLGAPLYYCEDCLRKVEVAGSPPVIKRACDHAQSRVIAPRRAIVAGEGGLSPVNKIKMAFYTAAAAVTGRNV